MKARLWIVLGMLGAASLACAQPMNDNNFTAECCTAQWAYNTAQKAAAFCQQHRQSRFGSEGSDPCQLEKDALQQYSKEYAQVSQNAVACPDTCRSVPN